MFISYVYSLDLTLFQEDEKKMLKKSVKIFSVVYEHVHARWGKKIKQQQQKD